MLGVGADEAFVEDAAGKPIEMFLFNGLKHAHADLGDVGDVIVREALLLACFVKFVAELAHAIPIGRSGLRPDNGDIIGQAGLARH